MRPSEFCGYGNTPGRRGGGYFIEGMSGAQFIREKDFSGAMHALEQPSDEIIG